MVAGRRGERAQRPHMNVKLTPNSEHLLREYLTRGPFHSPEEVIEHALEVLAQQEPTTGPHPSGPERTPEKFAAFLDALAAYSDKIPPQPGETFSREMIYQDHA
jgi:hypothetical protein